VERSLRSPQSDERSLRIIQPGERFRRTPQPEERSLKTIQSGVKSLCSTSLTIERALKNPQAQGVLQEKIPKSVRVNNVIDPRGNINSVSTPQRKRKTRFQVDGDDKTLKHRV